MIQNELSKLLNHRICELLRAIKSAQKIDKREREPGSQSPIPHMAGPKVFLCSTKAVIRLDGCSDKSLAL